MQAHAPEANTVQAIENIKENAVGGMRREKKKRKEWDRHLKEKTVAEREQMRNITVKCTTPRLCSIKENAYSIILLLYRKQKMKRANLSSCTLVRLASGDSLSPSQRCWKGHGENTPALSIKGADTHSDPLVLVSVQANVLWKGFA